MFGFGQLIDILKKDPKKIVFTEGDDPRILEAASRLLAGTFLHPIVKEDGKLLILADGKEILPEALSRGTLEQIYLAFRLAVGEIVTKEEPMPVIFDEAFGMYDEKRLMQTLRALDCQIRKEQGRQILIFTCQKREMELLEQSGITYHKIVLE